MGALYLHSHLRSDASACHGVAFAKKAQRSLRQAAARPKARRSKPSFGEAALKPHSFPADHVRHEDEAVREPCRTDWPRARPPDVAVNNAGTEGNGVNEQTSDSYAGMFDTNVLGTFLSLSRKCGSCAAGSAASKFLRTGRARCGESRAYTASKQRWNGLRIRALEAAPSGCASMQSRLSGPSPRCSIV